MVCRKEKDSKVFLRTKSKEKNLVEKSRKVFGMKTFNHFRPFYIFPVHVMVI